MNHTYQITGMTCNGCVQNVKKALNSITGIDKINIELASGNAEISMKNHVDTPTMQQALQAIGHYTITEKREEPTVDHASEEHTEADSDIKRLFPLLLVFSYLIGGVLLSQLLAGEWNGMQAMQMFMGGFFVVFSFFKLLDVKSFAYSFASYDLIAKRWIGYGFAYPFVELALGLAYLSGVNLLVTNTITLVLVSIGTVGVAKALLNKRKIQCACLGTVFNLPMTKVTLTENSVMIVMALMMLIRMM